MGRKGNCFSAVKKALNSEPKKNSSQSEKSKKKWFKKRQAAANTAPAENAPATTTVPPAPVPPPVVPHGEQPELTGMGMDQTKLAYTATIVVPEKTSGVDREQTKHAYKVALATAKASDATNAAAEVVCLTAGGPFTNKTKEELAAIKVQTAFRGYMARRTLSAIRGLVRLKSLMQGQAVKQQTASTLKYVQTLAQIQSQIRERRLRMAVDNLTCQFKQKHIKAQAKDLEKLQKSGNGWNSSGKTEEDIAAKLQSKHEAAIRRERTLAYAFSHQQTWKASGMCATKLFMDPNNPHWGWSWLERWLDTKPWETTPIESSNESSPCTKHASGNEILKAYAQRHNAEKPSPKSVRKQPRSSTAARPSTSARPKLISPSPKTSPRTSIWGLDNDNGTSTRSEQPVRDDESVSSSLNVSTYMAPTKAAKARLRLAGETKRDKSVTPDRSSVSSAKKRVSRLPSPATTRRSSILAADVSSISDHTYVLN